MERHCPATSGILIHALRIYKKKSLTTLKEISVMFFFFSQNKIILQDSESQKQSSSETSISYLLQ